MRNQLRAIVAVGVTATGLLVATSASAAPTADGVFFVHGTGDQSAPSTYLNPTDGAVSYWGQSSINSMIADPAGGNWNYGVAGYAGGSQNAQTSYATVATQLLGFYHSYGPLLNIVVVTHSNGSNPIRYLLAHPTAMLTDPKWGNVCAGYLVGGTCTSGHYVGTFPGIIKKAVFIAGDNAGTPLADLAVRLGNFSSFASNILSDVFGAGVMTSSGAIPQQVQATMTTLNNGTFATGQTPNGMAVNYVYGSGVNAGLFSSEAWCGGYLDSVGLKATQIIGWGSSSAATDGFIGTNSSTLVGTDPNGYGGDSKLNHNQSRKSCDGVSSKIVSYVHSSMNGAFTAPPPDYTEPPAVQACDLATPQWLPDTSGHPNQYYVWGCTSAMHADTSVDDDCEAIYGTDAWSSSANNYTVSIPFDYAQTGYSNPIYYYPYTQQSGGCSDTWLGNGVCDLCLLAKYGYDTASGATGDDDCYNQGSGTQTTCGDILYGASQSANVYADIFVNH